MDLYNFYPKFVKARNESMHLRLRQKMQWCETIFECSFLFSYLSEVRSPHRFHETLMNHLYFSEDININRKLLRFILLRFLSVIKYGLKQALI